MIIVQPVFHVRGRRIGRNPIINVNEHELSLHHNFCNHSVSFEWGYAGSGPAQLSWELLYSWCLECMRPRVPFRKIDNRAVKLAIRLADKYHQRFKFAIVSRIPLASTEWSLEFINFFTFFLGETHDVW